METNGDPKILLDCDVVIHFLKGGKILELPSICPGRFVMLDKVHNELRKRNSNILAIGIFLASSKIPVIPFPDDFQIVREYLRLKNLMDDGEAACLAVAKFRKEYVASSNITQITDYCTQNGILFFTTMDLLTAAWHKGVMSEAECDQFISAVKSKGSRLPCNTLHQFRKFSTANKALLL